MPTQTQDRAPGARAKRLDEGGRPSAVRRTRREVAQHATQRHFRFAGLEPALDRRLQSLLNFGVLKGLTEELRISAKLLARRECDRIDPLFHHDVTTGGKPGDTLRERADEIAQGT